MELYEILNLYINLQTHQIQLFFILGKFWMVKINFIGKNLHIIGVFQGI